MKIAINTRFLLPRQLEGIGRYTYEVCRRLVEQHPEHEYLFLFDRPYDSKYIFSERVQAKAVPPPARHPLLWYLWFEWQLPRVLRRAQADVFFSPDGFAALSGDTPTVLTVHDLAFEEEENGVPALATAYYQYFTPRYCAKAKQVLSVSDYTKQDLQLRYGIAADKITVCGNGCRRGFSPLSASGKAAAQADYNQGKPYFLYIGAIHPRKNVHRLIEAFSQFKSRTQAPAALLIAGRFAWKAGKVRAAYERSDWKSDIRFLGYVSDAELPRLLGGATGFVYPSLFEGFGLPILEAMQAEVPVITSRTTSMPEVAGKAALLVDPYEVPSIAHALCQLYENPNLQRQLVAKGRRQREQFTWDRTAQVVHEAILKAALH